MEELIIDKRVIQIGSSGRNSGKTTLAEKIIYKYKDSLDIYGLKITTISQRNMKCPRGGDGCGVCTSLTKDFDIKEIKKEAFNLNKDTTRILLAGCKKVFWMRAYKDRIKEAYQNFLKLIPKECIIIVESNSLRKIVEPRVFIVIKNTDDENMKESCRSVIEKADYILDDIEDFTYDMLGFGEEL